MDIITKFQGEDAPDTMFTVEHSFSSGMAPLNDADILVNRAE